MKVVALFFKAVFLVLAATTFPAIVGGNPNDPATSKVVWLAVMWVLLVLFLWQTIDWADE